MEAKLEDNRLEAAWPRKKRAVKLKCSASLSVLRTDMGREGIWAWSEVTRGSAAMGCQVKGGRYRLSGW